MPLLSNNSPIDTKSNGLSRAKWVALALPISVAAGCSGFQNGPVIDYTVSEADYLALTTPAAPKEIVPPTDRKRASDSVLVAEASAKEPVVAAAKAAAAPAPIAVQKSAAMQMEDNKQTLLPSLTSPTMAAKEEEPELAAAFDINKLGFTPSIYATAGLGVSRANPDTSAAPGFSIADDVAAAGQVAIGVDVHKNLSLELHSADYGSTAISPQGRVNFHVNGISALVYAGKAAGRYRRNGWNGYARIGYNEIENTPVGDVPFIEQSSARGSFGLGVEYNTRRGIGFRADATAYDGDVQYGQLGVLYRVGKKPKRPALALAQTKAPELPAAPVAKAIPSQALPVATPAPKSLPANAPAAAEAAAPVLAAALPETAAPKMTAPKAKHMSDPMLDGDIKLSQVTLRTISSENDECTHLNGTMKNVTFSNGSARLTRGASIELNSVAHTLNGCADRPIVISAHTDNAGPAYANDALAKMRARNVALYLGRRGVSMSRISAVSYGESRPVASNVSAEGRMQNRRVELEVR